MIVAFDREACLMYKRELDKLLPPEASEIVMTVNASEAEYQPYNRSKDAAERILDHFRSPAHPLKLLIVTLKLLTSFGAPILQAMYLDKPMKDHNLLQMICRFNACLHSQRISLPRRTA